MKGLSRRVKDIDCGIMSIEKAKELKIMMQERVMELWNSQ